MYMLFNSILRKRRRFRKYSHEFNKKLTIYFSLNPDEVKDKFRQYYNLHLLCVKQLLLWIQTLPSTICQNIKPRQTVENQKENDECKRREKSYFENKIGTDYIHILRPRPIKFNKPT